MRSLRFALGAIALAAATAAGVAVSAQEAGKKAPPPEAPKHAAFEQMKKLAGEWTGSSQMGEGPATPTKVTYRVTSGDSALIETVFAGSDHEMVTVYTVDKGELVLTHYCALGNQPHMKAAAQTDPKVIEFTCTGAGGNMASENEQHMHAGSFTWTDDDHLKTAWTMHENGKPVGQAKLDLARAK